jgi:hypothetical protein
MNGNDFTGTTVPSGTLVHAECRILAGIPAASETITYPRLTIVLELLVKNQSI